MPFLLALLAPLQATNAALGRVARWGTVAAMTTMVAAILTQVFCRYVLNNALPWPDEAARFCMLWMTGLIAPVAYRRGGFVAIETLSAVLPRRAGAALALLLLAVSLAVLLAAIPLGHRHVMSGCLFRSASLWLPFTLEFAVPLPGTGASLTLCTRADAALSLTWGWVKMPLAVMYASLFVGAILLTLVNLELTLRAAAALFGAGDRLPPLPHEVLEAE